uniref:Uncharacterized protein n=1 Tax=Lactuca sativa TaxID=4236 RepID=A0A9R1V6V8_LACSA|nr:hypothetical protein LSAT_V11C600306790 [Lactuca sativa]
MDILPGWRQTMEKYHQQALEVVLNIARFIALSLNLDANFHHNRELKNLKELEVSSSKVTDHGVTFLKDIVTLLYLNLSRCNLTDNGCDKFSSKSSSGCFVPLDAGLNNLESLNLDSFRIRDNELINLAVNIN